MVRYARSLAFLCGLPSLAGCALLPSLPGLLGGGDESQTAEARPADPEPAAGPAPGLAWPQAADCRTLATALVSMPPDQLAALAADAAPLAVAVAKEGVPLAAGRVVGTVQRDVPVQAAGPGGGSAKCTLTVEPLGADITSDAETVGHETVLSKYRSGERKVANPEYSELKQQLKEYTSSDGFGGGIMTTGDPTLDLIGLAAGVVIEAADIFGRKLGKASVEEKLADTPKSFSEPIWQPYSYEVTSIRLTKTAPYRITLQESGGPNWSTTTELTETATFRVATGRRATDRHVLEGGSGDVMQAEVTAWKAAPLQPRVSRLLASLADGPPAETIEPAAGPETAPLAVGRGPVKVVTDQGEVTGKLLADGRIQLKAGDVGRSAFVEVVGKDGVTRYGVVETFDSGRGIAIVKLQGA
ncbi:MAG: hypothetical protein U1E45_00900 [Geminicoccaceae bacterium]